MQRLKARGPSAGCIDGCCLAPSVLPLCSLDEACSALFCLAPGISRVRCVSCLARAQAMPHQCVVSRWCRCDAWSAPASQCRDVELSACCCTVRLRRPWISWCILLSLRVSTSGSLSRSVVMAAMFWLAQGNDSELAPP